MPHTHSHRGSLHDCLDLRLLIELRQAPQSSQGYQLVSSHQIVQHYYSLLVLSNILCPHVLDIREQVPNNLNQLFYDHVVIVFGLSPILFHCLFVLLFVLLCDADYLLEVRCLLILPVVLDLVAVVHLEPRQAVDFGEDQAGEVFLQRLHSVQTSLFHPVHQFEEEPAEMNLAQELVGDLSSIHPLCFLFPAVTGYVLLPVGGGCLSRAQEHRHVLGGLNLYSWFGDVSGAFQQGLGSLVEWSFRDILYLRGE